MHHVTEVASIRAAFGQLPCLQGGVLPLPGGESSAAAGRPGAPPRAPRQPPPRTGSFEKIQLAMQGFHDAYADAEQSALDLSHGPGAIGSALLLFTDALLLGGASKWGLPTAAYVAGAGLVLSLATVCAVMAVARPPLTPCKATLAPVACLLRGAFSLLQLLQLLLLVVSPPASMTWQEGVLLAAALLQAALLCYIGIQYTRLRRHLIQAVRQNHKEISNV